MTDEWEKFTEGFAAYLTDPQREVETAEAEAEIKQVVGFATTQLGREGHFSEKAGDYWWFGPEDGWALSVEYGAEPGRAQVTYLMRGEETLLDLLAIYAIIGYCYCHGIHVMLVPKVEDE